ncbi:MAG: alpha/beta fold hydrolase [Steroidobacteraceae bacterium]
MAALTPAYKEQVALLGKDSSLVSIIARPEACPGGDRPAIVILNTGIIHRVGHHRMYVALSRALASQGHTVVRFDFSGIGDSASAKDRLPLLAACLGQIRDVIDSVERTYQIRRFVLVGLCSGADHAILHARNDARVVGLVLMDPTLPPTARYYFHYVMQRLAHPRNWLSVVSGRSGLVRLLARHLRARLKSAGKPAEQPTLESLQFSPQLAECYRAVAQRNVKTLAVFTSVSARHTYPRQMIDAFPETRLAGILRLEYFPDSDHHFSLGQSRTRLVGLIADWLGSG